MKSLSREERESDSDNNCVLRCCCCCCCDGSSLFKVHGLRSSWLFLGRDWNVNKMDGWF
jgi:hypothetical protein